MVFKLIYFPFRVDLTVTSDDSLPNVDVRRGQDESTVSHRQLSESSQHDSFVQQEQASTAQQLHVPKQTSTYSYVIVASLEADKLKCICIVSP